MYNCPECGNQVEDHAVFCDYCGLRLAASVEAENQAEVSSSPPNAEPYNDSAGPPPAEGIQPGTCSACGFVNVPGEMFCQNCGVQLAPVASVPPPMPMPVAASDDLETAIADDVCPACGYQNQPGETFCQNCGIQLASPAKDSAPVDSTPKDSPPVVSPSGKCSSCGFPITSGDTFCENCGFQHIIDEPQEVEPPGSEPQPGDNLVCSYCGHTHHSVVKYCDNCGVVLEAPGPALVEVVPQAPEQAEAPGSVEPAEAESPGDTCPNCTHPRDPELEFCENCGLLFSVEEPGPVPPPPQDPVDSQPDDTPVAITGKLVLKANGVEILLPSGKTELLLGRSDPLQGIFPDVDFANYGGDTSGVSRSHARLSISGPQLYIEDLNSTNFTFLNTQRLDPGQRYALGDGDEIRLGLLLIEYNA